MLYRFTAATVLLAVIISVPIVQGADAPLVRCALTLDRAKVQVGGRGPVYAAVDIELAATPGSEQKPVAIVFVIDTSGSMSDESRLERVKAAALVVLNGLSEQRDRLSIVTFENGTRDVYSPSGPFDRKKAEAAFRSLQPGGGTNMVDGVRLGMQKLKEIAAPGGVKRMFLFGDGDANVGEGDMQKLAAWARDEDAAVSTFGVGSNFNETIMKQIAEVSGGNFYVINDVSKTERTVSTEFDEVRSLATAQVQMLVKTPWGLSFTKAFGQPAAMEAGPRMVSLRDLETGSRNRLLVRLDPTSAPPAGVTTGRQDTVAVVLNYYDRGADDGRQVVAYAPITWVATEDEARASVNRSVLEQGQAAAVADALDAAADRLAPMTHGSKPATGDKAPTVDELRNQVVSFAQMFCADVDGVLKFYDEWSGEPQKDATAAAATLRQKARDLRGRK